MNRCVLPVSLCLAACAWLSAGDPFVPDNLQPVTSWSQRSDANGVGWFIYQDGSLRNANNSAFNNAAYFYLDGNTVSFQRREQTVNGTELVFQGQSGNLRLIRRVKFDQASGLVRYVDSFINTGKTAVSSSFNFGLSLQYNIQTVVDDTGTQVGGNVPPKATAVAVARDQRYGSYPDVLLVFAAPGSRQMPSTYNQHSSGLNLEWNLSIPPGRAVSLMHVIMQRDFRGTPDSKALAALLKPIHARPFISDLPQALRSTIINWRRVSAMDQGLTSAVPMELLQARGDGELLALGQGTRLRGESTASDVVITGPLGSATVAWSSVMAARGGARGLVALHDGQVLHGTLAASSLTFQMAAGNAITLTTERMGWVVRRDEPARPRAPLLIETVDGNRLAVTDLDAARITLSTAWGAVELRLSDVAMMRRDSEMESWVVKLLDGTVLNGELRGNDLQCTIAMFGPRRLAISSLLGMFRPATKASDDKDEEVTTPWMMTANGNLLMGQVALPAVTVRQTSVSIPFPPEQARTITLIPSEDPLAPGVMATVNLWNGDTAMGRLEHTIIPVRVLNQVLRIPATEIAEIHVPKPMVPTTARTRIATLIADLGHQQWQRREAATKELSGMGESIRTAIDDALITASDPEVKHRLRQVLENLK